MTIEGIIRMAKQAGFADEEIDICQQILIHFATLVAQQEREACAKVCESGADCLHPTVEGHVMKNFGASSHLANAIRARGQA